MKMFAAALVGAMALASSANAVTYDAFASFNGTQGAGGFIYMRLPGGPGGQAAMLTAPVSCIVTSDYCLQDGGALPGVYKSLTGGTEGTYTIPNDRLLVHPGVSSPIAVFFVAPEAGDYDFTLSLSVLDRSPSGVSAVGLSNVGGQVSTEVLTFLSANNLSYSRSGSISLAKNDLFGVFIAPAGNYSNDSTGVNFTVSTAAVPEPAAWALMIGGFGMAGATLRRKRLAA